MKWIATKAKSDINFCNESHCSKIRCLVHNLPYKKCLRCKLWFSEYEFLHTICREETKKIITVKVKVP